MRDRGKRRIVVTGVSRGLGRALAAGFIAEGHTVFGCARNAAAIGDLEKRWGEPHRFRSLDVRSDDAVAAWAEEILAGGDPPDLLVNNAAAINGNAPLWEVPPDEFAEVIDTNIKGIVNVIRHLVPPMVARGTGVIVNFSSGWGRSTSPDVAPYCASKWAVEGLTRSLASELPRGMAAVPLNPGIIHTAMLESCFGASASSHPEPGEWAREAVPFILSLDGRHNGQPVTVP